MADILVVDDEIGIRELLSEILGDEGHTVLLAESAQQARELRAGQSVDLVLLDIWMPDTDGVTLLREWASSGLLSMPVIMMSGHATIDTAVEATRIGAVDFLEKPITLQKLLRAVSAGLAHGQSQRGMPRAQSTGSAVLSPPPAAVQASVAGLAGVTGASARPLSPGAQPAAAVPGARPHTGATGAQPLSVDAATSLARPGLVAGPPGEAAELFEAALAREVERSPVIHIQTLPLDAPLRDARDAFERAYFEYHLQREQGSMTRVAERTGLERTHLYRKLKQLGIDLSRGAWRKQQL
jgi:DNA-binding NtrC family response regulator